MKKYIILLAAGISHMAFALSPAENLQAKLNAMHSMTAHFKQSVTAKKHEVSSSSGTMALQRPGRFRWQTRDPMEQLIVADGKKMWVYDVDLEQVTVKKQAKGLGGTAALFLSGYDDDMTRDFAVTERQLGKNDEFDLKSLRSKENFQRIKMSFSNGRLTGLELYDQLGQVTKVTLSRIQTNSKIDKKQFQFIPPKGVDVVQQ